MDRVVIIIEYGGGMFSGVQGMKILTVPEDADIGALFPGGGYVRISDEKSADYSEPQHANSIAAQLKALGAQDLPVEWIVIS